MLPAVKSIFISTLIVLTSFTYAQTAKEEIDKLVSSIVDDGKLAGVAVSVMHEGDFLLNKVYGMADIENNIELTTNHQLQIASITKTFTAAAIYRLLDLGELELNEHVSKYLPYYVSRGHDPTILQLMQHTSGLYEYTRFSYGSSELTMRNKILNKIQNVAPIFEPGTGMAYNNSGYYLLGLIIEEISGKHFSDFIRDEFLLPLGLNDISYYQPNDGIKRSKGYDHIDNKLVPGRYSEGKYADPDYPYAAGNLTATAKDLCKWFYALNEGEVLSKSSYSKMLETATLPGNHKTRYGSGIMVEMDPSGRKIIHHAGSNRSFQSQINYYPEHNFYVTVIANTTAMEARPEIVSNKIADIVTEMQPRAYNYSYPKSMEKLTGTYMAFQSGRQRIVDIYIEDEKLMIAEAGRRPEVLFYTGQKNYFTTGTSAYGDVPSFEFIINDTIKELHYLDNSQYSILTTADNKEVQYWKPGGSLTSKVKVEGHEVRIRTRTPFSNRFPGQPMVIMEAGYGNTLNNWGDFFNRIGDFIPTLSYDRTGLGESEIFDHVPTDDFYVGRLNKLLETIEAKGPFVLLGFSYGCDLIRLFADKYPEKTSGLLLIDPATAQPSEFLRAFEAIGDGREEFLKLADVIYPEDGNPYERKHLKPLYENLIDQFPPKPLDLPVKVFFAGQKPPPFLIEELHFDVVAHQKVINELILKRTADWIYQVPEGEMTIIPSSSHSIHLDEPDIVFNGVKSIVYPSIGRALQRILQDEGVEAAEASYYARKAYYPVDRFNEDLLNDLGYKLVRAYRYDHAIAIFKLNTSEYPDEANPYDSLGDAYRFSGDLENAVASYKRAAELAEQNDDSRAANYRKRYKTYKDTLDNSSKGN